MLLLSAPQTSLENPVQIHPPIPAILSRREFVAAGGLVAAGLAMPSLALATTPIVRWPGVSGLVRDYVDSGKVANMVAAIGLGNPDPDVMAQGTTSFTSTTRVDADTLYRIYSMTKPITGMAIMRCIEEGWLELDQPIADIIPGFANMQVQKVYDGPITADNLEPAIRPITVRHCLTHTAGLGYGIVQQGPISQAYTQAGLVPGSVTRLQNVPAFRGTPVGSLRAFAEGLAEMPLVHQPGTKWSYSVGLDLLGRVIEVVSGQPFDRFLQERFFDPLAMTSTMFQLPQSQVPRFTTNYYLLGGTLLPIDLPESSIYLDEPPFPFGGAGLVSSARDYDRFLRMLAGRGMLDGVRVLDRESADLGTSDLFPDTLAADGGFSTGGRAFGFGAGGLVGRGDAAGLFGWFGAAGTCGLVNMAAGLRQTLMTQYMPSQDYPLQNDFPVIVAADAAALARTRG
ncbi:MAG TPA: serine hydrolase domain-containing protein [Paracoccaceae bacterium]|nr:serine hydrolase domain-containing protein [Paracoccaceae bacterium]